LALLAFTEYNTGTSGQFSVVLFKRGSKAAAVAKGDSSPSTDEEKTPSEDSTLGQSDPKANIEGDAELQKAMSNQPKMTDVFSWQHIKYVVPVGQHERRQLLDDVSGYVAPGKLTLLMGASGAGKVSHPKPGDYPLVTLLCRQLYSMSSPNVRARV
jgi:ATP-binding cassette subfamily G (WHITE) protein 2 (SNQ2)